MSLMDKLIGPAIGLGGGIAAGAIDGEQVATAAKAGQTVTTPMSIVIGALSGVAGLFGEKFIGKKVADIALKAGTAIASGGVAIATYQSTVKANGSTDPSGSAGITATSTTTPPAVAGYRRGAVGALPGRRGPVGGREIANAYALLR